MPGDPSDGMAHPLPDPLERDGDGRAREPQAGRSGRPYRELRLDRRHFTTSASTISGARRARTIRAIWCSIRAIRSPGIYARSFLEGRIGEEQLDLFRMEVAGHGRGLSSYPHPWLMPDYWQVPTVSMGLGPIQAIYQAQFWKYLEHRGLIPQDRPQGLVLHRRRRIRRARVARRDLAGRPRRTRQPDLRRQLQPAAPGRSGARQRQDHPGTRRRVPRRRLERASRWSGAATGIRCSRATPRACCAS